MARSRVCWSQLLSMSLPERECQTSNKGKNPNDRTILFCHAPVLRPIPMLPCGRACNIIKSRITLIGPDISTHWISRYHYARLEEVVVFSRAVEGSERRPSGCGKRGPEGWHPPNVLVRYPRYSGTDSIPIRSKTNSHAISDRSTNRGSFTR